VRKKTGVVIGVGHHDHSTCEGSNTIKRLIDSGDMGTITAFEKTTCHAGGFMIKPGDWRGDPDKNPGGMLFQCGVHGFHELMYHFGPIKRIQAVMRYDVHATETADAAICIVEHGNGVVGNLNAYHVCPYRHTFSVFGTKKNLYRVNRNFSEGTSLMIQTEYLDDKEQPLEQMSVKGTVSEASNQNGNLISFYNAVRNGGTPYPSLSDGERAVAAVFAAEESSKKSRLVEIPEIP